MAKLTRKCKICGKDFNITNNKYIKIKGSYMEVECYKAKMLRKGLNIEDINKQIDLLLKEVEEINKEKANKEMEILKKQIRSKNKEKNRTDNLKRLIAYFQDNYNISTFPNYFYSKLAEINRGTYKGVLEGIPYEDILDMFIRKQDYLNKVADRNLGKGKKMNGIGRINYDLAIIINKYDDYLKWKNKNKVLESDINAGNVINKKEQQIDYSKISNMSSRINKNELDIADILDDLY